MNAFPDPVPLDLPEEHPESLAEVVSLVSGAAFRFGVLGAHLAGPAAVAPGWLGQDASAAATQIGTATELVHGITEALDAASGRLSRHADLLAETCRRIAALRVRQEEDYAAAAARLGDAFAHPHMGAIAPKPAVVVALDDELRAAEAARHHQHAVLMAELRADALDTARTLAGATAVVGGAVRPGDENAVLAHLAARLPGWGDGELSARGAELARMLLVGGVLMHPDSVPLGAERLAASPAFADALLRILGPTGLRHVLFLLADQGVDAESPWATVLARALGAARRTGSVVDPVGEVLDATYVDPTQAGATDDFVAVGMATVLAASAALPRGGVPVRTVAAWGRQMLVREQGLRSSSPGAYRAVDRTSGGRFLRIDPVLPVLSLLARAEQPPAAALLLGDRRSWAALLGRSLDTYGDAGADLRAVVQQAASVEGIDGDSAVRAGLEALGSGLADGDPDHWPADRATAVGLSMPLAQAVARRADVASSVLLLAGGGGELHAMQDAALRGLGYLTIDAGAASVLGTAMGRWAAEHATAVTVPRTEWDEPEPVAPLVVGSFVALREYGQRLAYALHGFAMRDGAEAKATLWNLVVGLVIGNLPVVGEVAGMVDPFAARVFSADGRWDNGPDTGQRLDHADAVAAARVQLGAERAEAAALFAVEAARGFDRANRALGVPAPPVSPPWHWEEAARDAVPVPDVRGLLPARNLSGKGVGGP